MIDEARFRNEPRTVVQIERLQVKLAARPFQIDLVAWARQVRSISIQGGAGYGRALHSPVLVELEVGVGATDPVVAAAKFSIGKDSANRRLIKNVAADTPDRERRAVAAVRIARRYRLPWRAIVTGQNAHCPRA